MEFSQNRTHPSIRPAVAFAIAVAEVTAECHLRALGCEDAVSLQELPTDEERQAYELRDRQGLSVKAAAHLLHVSGRTMIRRRKRFLQKVRSLRLATRDGSCPTCKLLTSVQ